MTIHSLVRVARTRNNQRSNFSGCDYIQIQRRLNCLIGGSDGRDHRRAGTQVPKNVCWARGGEGYDRIGASTAPVCSPMTSTSAPEGISTAITGALAEFILA